MKRLFIAALAAFFVSGAQAQNCLTIGVAVAQAMESGGAFIELIDVPHAVDIDQILIVEFGDRGNGQGLVVLTRVRKGCLVHPAMPIVATAVVYEQ